MRYLDIRKNTLTWDEIYRLFNTNRIYLDIPKLKWTTQQRLDYLDSCNSDQPVRDWFVQQTRTGEYILKYGYEQFYTLILLQHDLIQHKDPIFKVSVSRQPIILRVIKPSVSEEEVQEVIRRYLNE